VMPSRPFAQTRSALPPALILALAVTLGTAGCGLATGPATGTPSVSSPTPANPIASVSLSPAAGTPSPSAAGQASPTPGATLPSKTTTEWGVIWDDIPHGFPRMLGSEPTETGAGPASAVLIVPARTQDAAAWYGAALPGAGYRIDGTSGPYEDGSYVIDATGAGADCRVQVSLAKKGTATIATIYFGAACPYR
jgi:hypothetical protein